MKTKSFPDSALQGPAWCHETVTKYLLQLICLKVLSRLEKVSVSLLPPGSEQTGNTNLMQEIESFDSPYQQQGGKQVKLSYNRVELSLSFEIGRSVSVLS